MPPDFVKVDGDLCRGVAVLGCHVPAAPCLPFNGAGMNGNTSAFFRGICLASSASLVHERRGASQSGRGNLSQSGWARAIDPAARPITCGTVVLRPVQAPSTRSPNE
jgi:hypothetical protein